jgi:hypothetical protein
LVLVRNNDVNRLKVPRFHTADFRFTIMRIMGHSSITVSQRQVHPTPETTENAFVAIELAAREAEQKRGGKRQGVNQAEKIVGIATNLAPVPSTARGVIE